MQSHLMCQPFFTFLTLSKAAAGRETAGSWLCISLVSSRLRLVHALCYESLKLRHWHLILLVLLYGLICVRYKSDEEAENHVDEKGDEGVKVYSTEEPHHVDLIIHVQKGGIHVIPVDEREEALRHFVQCPELVMIRPKDNPTTETVSKVDHGSTAAESNHIRKCCPEGQD